MNSQDFYNAVVLMRANQKAFFRLRMKSKRTPEEEELKKQYLNNSLYFERIVDDEIERVNLIMQKKSAL